MLRILFFFCVMQPAHLYHYSKTCRQCSFVVSRTIHMRLTCSYLKTQLFLFNRILWCLRKKKLLNGFSVQNAPIHAKRGYCVFCILSMEYLAEKLQTQYIIFWTLLNWRCQCFYTSRLQTFSFFFPMISFEFLLVFAYFNFVPFISCPLLCALSNYLFG